MEWTDKGIVVGVRRHGETAAIVDLLTREHGRHSGFVHGALSRRMRPSLQAGNSVGCVWRSRIEEQLGAYAIEAVRLRGARLMESAAALHAVNHLCALVRLLAEREPHPALHDALEVILDSIDDAATTAPAVARFELAILGDLGFGLDLGRCAVTGTREELVYVSPKSGRAVSREVGAAYHDRLFALPPFLHDAAVAPAAGEVAAAFRLTGHFIARDLFEARGLPVPEARGAYLRAAGLIVLT